MLTSRAALGVGEKAIADAPVNPDFQGDGSEYSGGLIREKALGMDNIKFYRADSEGETPSTLTDGAPPMGALPPDPALKTIMEQRGLFELSSRRRSIDSVQAMGSVAQTRPADQRSRASTVTSLARGTVAPTNQSQPTNTSMTLDIRPGGTASHSPIGTSPSTPWSADSPSSPTAPPRLNTADSSSSIPLIQIEKGLNVLVVDDDALTRRLMSRMLTRLGCVVDTAENGKIALDKILANKNDAPAEGANPNGGSGPASSVAPAIEGYDIVFLDNQMVCVQCPCSFIAYV